MPFSAAQSFRRPFPVRAATRRQSVWLYFTPWPTVVGPLNAQVNFTAVDYTNVTDRPQIFVYGVTTVTADPVTVTVGQRVTVALYTMSSTHGQA